MRKFLLLFLLIPMSLMAQVSNPSIISVAVAPSGACTAGLPNQQVTTTGVQYSCQGGTWAAIGGGSGSGTVNAGTTGQIAYYGANGTAVSGNNPAALGIAPTSNAIYATNYGVKPDGVFIYDATVTNTSSTVTCPNSDCFFTSADIGKTIFATNATTDVSMLTSTVVLPEGTITAVASANSITVSSTATSTVTGAAFLVYGTLNSAAYNATQTTANDPIFAAWSAAESSCSLLQLPAGIMLTDQPQFITYTTTTPCASASGVDNTRRGYSILGEGQTATFIVPTPNLDPAKCIGPNTAGGACFFSVPSLTMQNLSLYGAGNSTLAAGFSGKYAIGLASGGGTGSNHHLDNFIGHGWGANTTGFVGMQVGGVGTGILSGTWLTNVGIETLGAIGLQVNIVSVDNGPVDIYGGYYVVNKTNNVNLQNGTINSVNSEYGVLPGTGVTAGVFVNNNAFFNSFNDYFWTNPSSGAGNEFFCEGFCTIDQLQNMHLASGANNLITSYGSSARVVLSNTAVSISGTSTGNALFLDNGGKVIDGGGNTLTGAIHLGAGFILGDQSVNQSPAVAGNFALGAQWGTSPTTTAVTGTGTLTQFTVTAGTGSPSASPTITFTFPIKFWIAPICNVPVFPAPFTGITSVTSSTTSAVVTLTGTPVASTAYTFQLSCRNP